MGLWFPLKPRSRPRGEWRYAHYIETPDERSDGNWFEVLYFRDVERSRFGKLEFVGPVLHSDFRNLATKIDSDRAYRESLLSDDPELPKLWRKR
jgi:hypothetical protein